MFKVYKKYIPHLIVCFALLFLEAFADLAMPEYMAQMMEKVVGGAGTLEILKIGGIMLGYAALVTGCSVLVGYIASVVGSGTSRKLREMLFSKVSDFSAAEFDKFRVSSLITRSTNDVTQVQMFTIMFVRIVMYAPILAVGGIIKAIANSTGMDTLVWVIVAAVGAIICSLAALMLIVQPKFTRLQKIVDRLNSVARESLTGKEVVRAFGTQRFEESRFDEVNTDLKKTQLFVNRIMGLFMPIVTVVMNGVSIAVIWLTSYQATDIAMVTSMMAFIQYAVQIIMAFMMVTMVFVLMPRAVVSVKRINEVLKSKISIVDREGAIKAENTKGELVFENVSFRYGDSEDAVLKDISFTSLPGQTTAIIGATGSGKSTLIKLIPRLYDVSEGCVKLDGRDVRDYTVDSLRDNISFVPQKNVLLKGTIESNIKYNDIDGNVEDMKTAAEIAQATEFIDSKENGYESEIAQGGGNVSGGQKQRLAIARALYKKAPVYIFDDSFSALDFKTDAALRAALKEKLADKNIIIVAQRVGSIMNADQILVLDEGRLVGKGTHSELMKTCSVYNEIAHSQLSKEELQNA
ncbi:MAG: ABC transporter ATP-binding protein [Clostridia bacterium]|jgi:ATP-binding cassette subfamily B protein|nr:ABC transporter ATP-binding protein [Clostridia bacterium]